MFSSKVTAGLILSENTKLLLRDIDIDRHDITIYLYLSVSPHINTSLFFLPVHESLQTKRSA